MRIGIFGSSMDPISTGHLISANEMRQRRKLDKIIFLPSSHKRSDKTPNVSDEHRWNMLNLAIANNSFFEASDYEMKQEAWNIYTYHTMKHFKEIYPGAELFFLMGADLLADLPHWKYGEELIAENKFIVIKRKVKVKLQKGLELPMDIPMEDIMASHKLLRKYEEHFDFINKGVANETSSSFIREEIENGFDPQYYTPDSVYEYIKEHGLYGYQKPEIKE